MLIIVCKWYLILLAAGVIGYRTLLKLGLNVDQAWSGGRVCGLATVIFLPWWLGHLSILQWQKLGLAIFLLLLVWALVKRPRIETRFLEIVRAEALFLIGFIFVLLIRLHRPEILWTEKFMDFGILNSLLRTENFPPEDFWLAGKDLAYYYWGLLIWVLPLKILSTDTATMYNLIVATIGGCIATLSWSLGRSLTMKASGGWLTVYFCLFAGTLDGVRQLAASRSLEEIDIWQSTRIDPAVITEFPLFSLWLGDLHPHLLSVPFTLVTLLVALHVSKKTPTIWNILFLGIFSGLVLATNPWSFPPTVLTVAILITFGRHVIWWGGKSLLETVGLTLILVAISFLSVAPFLVNYKVPINSLGLVSEGSEPTLLVLYAGVLLVPLFAVLYPASGWNGKNGDKLPIDKIVLTTIVFMVAAFSARPALTFLVSALMALIWVFRNEAIGTHRTAAIFCAMGIFMFLVPELLYVKDGYHETYDRMNTVFKSYFQAWMYLSIAVPVLLFRQLTNLYIRRIVIPLLVVAVLIHPISLLIQLDFKKTGFDGLSWMEPGDRAIVSFLNTLDDNAVILEVVGEAYSEAGRISSASGVPAYLGWTDHEIVWRGESIRVELDRRKTIAEEIYTEENPHVIKYLANKEGIDYLIIGSLERQKYTDTEINALKLSGEVDFSYKDSHVISMR